MPIKFPPFPVSRWLKFLLSAFLVAIAVLGIKSCTLIAPPLQPLTIGYSTWPGYQVLLYAQANGLFEKRGLTVKLNRYDFIPDNLRATMRGYQDASFAPLSEMLQADYNGEVPEIILAADISAGSDGIVARPGITSLPDLIGKKVSARSGTITYLVLLEALASQGIDPSQVEIVNVANQHGIQLLQQGEIDAATLWEPDLSSTVAKTGGQVIYTTAEVDSIVFDGLATRSDVSAKKRKELVQFIKVWFEIMDAIDANADEVFATVAEALQVNPAEFAQDYSGLKKGDRDLNERLLIAGELTQVIEQNHELISKDPNHGRPVHSTLKINRDLVGEAM
ncbi:MAG: ABC transporter substrate-binding protein [Synechocystis sp.]